MKFYKLNPNRILYFKIFMSLVLCIVATILVLAPVLYINFEKVASNQIYLANSNNLDQVKEEVSTMANVALSVSNQTYQDVSVSKLVYYPHPDIYTQSAAITQLNNYRLSIPFIDSIYLYNIKTNTIYTETGGGGPDQSDINQFSDKQAAQIMKNHRNYKQYIPIPRNYMNSNGVEKHYYTFIHYDIFAGDNLKSGIILTNISQDWIGNVINKGKNEASGDTFIMDHNGVVVSNSDKYPMITSISKKAYVKRILDNTDSSGYFVDHVNGVKSLIVYTKPDIFGWTYVRVLNWNMIYSGIENVRRVIILIGLTILLAGILISFMISGRIYFPIGNMISNLETLEREKDNNSKVLKQAFLRDLVLGKDISDRNEFQENLELSIDLEDELSLILFKIDDYNTYHSARTKEEQCADRLEAIDILSTIFCAHYQAEVVDMGGDAFIVLANVQKEGDNAEALTELLKNIQTSVMSELTISLSITISPGGIYEYSLHELYTETQEASLHRLFFGHGSIINSKEVIGYKNREYSYPIEKEKLLNEALMAGKMDEVRRIYDTIIMNTRFYSIIAVNLTISHLLLTLNNTINTIKANHSIADGLGFNLSLVLLNKVETIEGINHHFYEMFDKIERSLNEKKNQKYETMIRQVKEIINDSYGDQNLSIDSIAEAIGISTPYICRIYKQNTLHTILEDIVKTRMEKARELLLESNQPIEKIAEKVGFSNSSYFYKAFKTANGVTPSEYRKARREAL